MVIIISYNKQTWKEYNDSQTAHENLAKGAIISADRLNHMETGIGNNDTNKVTDNKNGSIQVNGSSITPADDSKVVHTTDTSNWQKQAMFNPGDYKIGQANSDTGFATLLRTKYDKGGVVYIRESNGPSYAPNIDTVVICEGMGWWYAYGVTSIGNFVHRQISPGYDTGWVVNADDSKVVHTTDASNWQKQAMFNPGDYRIDSCDSSTDFATLLRSKYNKGGIVYIRENNGPTIDTVVICEGTGWWYAYGVAGNGNFVYRQLNLTHDSGWVTNADDSKVVHNSGDEDIAGQKTFDIAPIDKTTGNPYITKSDIPKGAVIKVVTQAEYNKLTDKTGLYVIQG